MVPSNYLQLTSLIFDIHVTNDSRCQFPFNYTMQYVNIALELRGPIRGFWDTGYSRKKLPGYGIFKEKVIGIQDVEK